MNSPPAIPRWLALTLAPLAWLVVIPLGHGMLPWAISRLAARHGWTDGNPGPWNWLGLVAVSFGAVGLSWIMVIGFVEAARVPERVALDWSPKLLLVRGPYAFSRNPMYVAEVALWLGWTLWYGSLPVALGCAILGGIVGLLARREERDLEARFGEDYEHYRATVLRWLGRRSG